YAECIDLRAAPRAGHGSSGRCRAGGNLLFSRAQRSVKRSATVRCRRGIVRNTEPVRARGWAAALAPHTMKLLPRTRAAARPGHGIGRAPRYRRLTIGVPRFLL